MLRTATLGPAGSNHDLLRRHDLECHGLHQAGVTLVGSFAAAPEKMAGGEAAHVVQVAVHPQTTETLARAHVRHGSSAVERRLTAMGDRRQRNAACRDGGPVR